MQLIAKVTIQPGNVPPGETFEIKDKAEAESLIARGLAAKPKAAPAPAPKAEGGGDKPPPNPGGGEGKKD